MSFDRSRKSAGKKRTVVCFLIVSLLFHVVLLAYFADSGRKRERPSRVEVGLVFLPPMVAAKKNAPEAQIPQVPPRAAPTPAPENEVPPQNPSPPPLPDHRAPCKATAARAAEPPPDPPRPEPAPEKAARKPPAEEPPPAFTEDLPPLELSAPAEEEAGDLPADADAGSQSKPESAPFRDSGSASASAPLVEATPWYDRNDPPAYPRLARERGWEGKVLLRVVVSETGEVRNASVERPSPHAVLDAAALRAVRRWRFHPSRLGPTPVEGEVLVPLNFKLLDD